MEADNCIRSNQHQSGQGCTVRNNHVLKMNGKMTYQIGTSQAYINHGASMTSGFCMPSAEAAASNRQDCHGLQQQKFQCGCLLIYQLDATAVHFEHQISTDLANVGIAYHGQASIYLGCEPT